MLTDTQLLASQTVANATMNRGRGLTGVNSYARELRFDIGAFLKERVRENGQAVWYDACCGEGRALAEAADEFRVTDGGRHIRLIGTDLVGMFVPTPPQVELRMGDVVTDAPDCPLDLVTCVHGLHYLGDKLGFLERMYQSLALGGRLLAHLDTANLRCTSRPLWPVLARRARPQGVKLEVRHHVLSLERSGTALDFGAVYQGATVSDQPNYTGINVIDSWYTAH